MKKLLSLLGCLVLLCSISYSQNRSLKNKDANKLIPFASEIQFAGSNESPSVIIFDNYSAVTKEDFFTVTSKSLKSNRTTTWKLYNEKRDEIGFTHYRYQQYYNNVKVETGQYFLHERNGKIEKANGVYYSKIDVNPTPSLSYKSALTHALNYCGASVYMWQIGSEENWLKEHENNPLASYYPKGELVIMAKEANFKINDMHLCWKFDIYANEPMSRAFYYIDAHTGDLVYKQDRICTGVANGSALTMYSGTRAVTTDSTAINNFRLRDATRGAGVETYDMNNGTSYGAAVDFTDTDNNWTTTTDDDHAANDAHWGAANTYDYYLNILSRNSYDDAGSVIESYVHRGVNYNNAFWNGSVMTYGDGDGTTFTPLTALDVVGHEITHGVTEFSSNLVYSYESGALNESFSDIFGAAIEFYALGETNGDWIVGEDMTPSGTGIRNMMDPNIKSDPDTYLGAFWHTSSSDNGGVHTNSGVQNYWFYLLTEGGSGTNDNGDAFNITGLGLGPAAQIAYRNNNVYLTSSSQYADARAGAIQAAIDLYGPCSPEVESTTNAWYAVGVGNAYVPTVVADFESDITTACAPPYDIKFTNNSSNAGTFTWYFGDGTTSTLAQPTHTYNTYGSFDIKLISDGGVCGIDSVEKIAYISIDSLNPCIALVGDPTQTGCSGVLYDSGGPGASYDDNLNLVTTISPVNAATVTLTFNSFDVEPGSASTCNWDYVEIFDGPTTGHPSFGRFCNTTGSPGTIISTGPSLTVLFYSDAAVTHAGFDATWSCALSTAPPVSNFDAPFTQACDGIITFNNTSLGAVDSVHWDFGDGFTSNNYNPTHTYLTTGDYTVSLYVSNVNGSNINTKTNYISISRPPAPSVDDVSACGESVVALSAGATSVNWYDALVGGNLLGTGTTFNTPLLNTSTNYYAEEMYPAIQQTVGPVDNTFGGGAYFTGIQSLIFNCYKPSKLLSVWVDAQTVGARTIELRDNNGTILQDTTIMIIAPGGQRLTLNFNIPVGNDLQLGVGNTPNLFRNNTNVNFPYEIPGLISITRSTATSNPVGFYYFFYDWEVQGPDCPSERDMVTAIIHNEVSAAASVVNNLCYGDDNGSINTTVTTGTSPYVYLWNNGEVTSSQSFLIAGNYTVTITDQNNCSAEISSMVTEGSEILFTNSKRNVSCHGGNDGTATVNVSGGVSPYSISWNTTPVKTTAYIDSLIPAFYTATVTDANSCTSSTEIEIRVPDPLVAFYIPTNPTGANSNGTVNQLVTGGINPYTYLWSNGGTTEDLTNVPAGTYFSTVEDRNGCAVLSIVVLTSNPLIIDPTPANFSKNQNTNGLNIYPNPSSGTTRFQFELMEAGEYEILLYDYTGRKVLGYLGESEYGGLTGVEMDLRFLKNGIYIVNLNTNNGVLSNKLIKN